MVIEKRDAFKVTKAMLDRKKVDVIITNPPWSRDLMHPMIEHFITLRPTILLFDADWMHTTQAAGLIKRCARIISIGRVRWIPGTTMDGVDNACWYFFPMNHYTGPKFEGRKE